MQTQITPKYTTINSYACLGRLLRPAHIRNMLRYNESDKKNTTHTYIDTNNDYIRKLIYRHPPDNAKDDEQSHKDVDIIGVDM